MKLSRVQTLKILKEHGWKSTDQTEAENGKIVLKGSSFDEIIGIKITYDSSDVMEWLGY